MSDAPAAEVRPKFALPLMVPIAMIILANAIAIYVVLFGDIDITMVYQMWPILGADIGSILAVTYYELWRGRA